MLRQIHPWQKGYSMKMDTATDAVIIGNPNSGRAGDEEYLERFAEILRSGDLRVEVLNTEHPNHATELASLAGDRLVVAAGGDGTVNEVLNGLSPEATLGVLPLGTANVLARELGLPLDPSEACWRILEGERSRVDFGVATDDAGAERRFACMAGIGFDAKVIGAVTPRLKRYLRTVAFQLTAFKVFCREQVPHAGDTPRRRDPHREVRHNRQRPVLRRRLQGVRARFAHERRVRDHPGRALERHPEARRLRRHHDQKAPQPHDDLIYLDGGPRQVPWRGGARTTRR